MLPAIRAVLGLACFIVAGSALMLLVVEPGTGEFVVTVFSLAIGLALGAVAIPLIRMNGRHHH
jgi:hypothetical protein